MLTVTTIIISLVILVIIHELGHFVAAKAIGVKVLRFSVGFGPAIIKKQCGETEFVFAPVLLGGYVKLLGENLVTEIKDEDKPRSYKHQPVWKRIVIISSGVVANVLFAICIFFILLSTETSVIFQSFAQAITIVIAISKGIVSALYGIVNGTVSSDVIGGPVAIFDIARAKIQEGPQNYLYFVAALSVNLAVLNFLPIPVVDGGHIVMLLFEFITKKVPGARVAHVWNAVGVVLITMLTAVALYNDITIRL